MILVGEEPRSVSRSSSTESFEEIESLKSETSLSLIDMTAPKSRTPSPVITDEQRARIEKAIANQSAAMARLSQSETLKQMLSSSISQSEEQDITRNFERIDSQEIRSETENEIRKLAQKCEEEGMIKKSAYEGKFLIFIFLKIKIRKQVFEIFFENKPQKSILKKGEMNRAPMNSRAMSTQSSVTIISTQSEPKSQVWFDSEDFKSACSTPEPEW